MKYLSTLTIAALALATGMAVQAETPKIGVAVYKFDDTFMSYVRNSILDNAKGKANVDLVDSQNAQPTQNDQVDQFLAKKMAAQTGISTKRFLDFLQKFLSVMKFITKALF